MKTYFPFGNLVRSPCDFCKNGFGKYILCRDEKGSYVENNFCGDDCNKYHEWVLKLTRKIQ